MKRLILVLVFLFFISCSRNLIKEDKTCNYIKKGSVVVLPFDNMSNDLTATDMLRDMIIDGFKKNGWFVYDKKSVDEKLKEIGITDGGQLNAVDVGELDKLFNSDYLCYGYINDFKLTNLGFIIVRNVELEIKIVDSKTSQVVFDSVGKGSDTKIYLDKEEAKKAFAQNMALKLVENIAKRPLYKQAYEAVEKIFSKLKNCSI